MHGTKQSGACGEEVVVMRCLLKNATIINSNGENETVHILTEDRKIKKYPGK